jgi:hypothetical protein
MRSKPGITSPKAKSREGTPSTFPYELYRGTKVWRSIEKAIRDLVENRDIVETTPRDYIVGYICHQLQQL